MNLSDNRVSGDVFTDSYTSATFNNKTVAAGKTVSVSGISISGGAFTDIITAGGSFASGGRERFPPCWARQQMAPRRSRGICPS